MNLQYQLSQLKNLVTASQNALIFLPEKLDYDRIAGGLGLYLGLLKQGKLVTIASSSVPQVEEADLVAIDKIKQSLNGKNMIISLPYEEGSIEKVSYNFDGGTFNLVIEPKNAALKFSPAEVKYNYGGIQADLVFTIGVNKPLEIGKLYQQNKELFARNVVNIANRIGNANFGKVNIVNHKLPTISEIVVLILKNLGISLDKDLATNLYKGLQKGTDNFNPTIVSPLTLEAAALCLRSGARKTTAGIAQTTPVRRGGQIHPTVKPAATLPLTSQPVAVPAPASKPPSLPTAQSNTSSSDWLKPKIFSPSVNGAKQ